MSAMTTYNTLLEEARQRLTEGDYFAAELACVKAASALAQLPLEAQGGGQNGNMLKTRENLEILQKQIATLRKRDPNRQTPVLTSAPLHYAIPRGVANDWRS